MSTDYRPLGKALYNDLTGQGRFAIPPQDVRELGDEALSAIEGYIISSYTPGELDKDDVAADTFLATVIEVANRRTLSAEEEAWVKDTAEKLVDMILGSDADANEHT